MSKSNRCITSSIPAAEGTICQTNTIEKGVNTPDQPSSYIVPTKKGSGFGSPVCFSQEFQKRKAQWLILVVLRTCFHNKNITFNRKMTIIPPKKEEEEKYLCGCRPVLCFYIFPLFFCILLLIWWYVCVFLCCSGATKGCVWRTGPVRRAWTGAGGCGLPGRSAAGPVEAGCPLPSGTVTAPGMAFARFTPNAEIS